MNRSRSGVALVLALVILAALLLLGLPFLFSQTSSVAGARAFSDQVAAQEGQRSVERGGLGAGALAGRTVQLRTADTQYASLVEDLETALSAAGATTCTAAAIAGDRNRIRVILTDSATSAGVVVDDEAGRLDANALSAREWDALLRTVGVVDWDDNVVVHSRCDSYYSGGAWHNVAPGPYHQTNDGDPYGQLANALEDARFNRGRFPSQRYTCLEDLLTADPGDNRDRPPATTPYPSKPTTKFGLRRPLTRAELELLRPYLTFRSYGQGKHGAIEVGSAVSWYRPDPTAPPRVPYVDPPMGRSVQLDVDMGDAMRDGEAPSAPIARRGTVGILRWKDVDGKPYEKRFRYWGTGGRSIGFDDGEPYPNVLDSRFTGFQFAIEAPSPINLNQASGVVRSVLEMAMGATLAAPAALPGAPLSTLGTWNLGWLDPVWSGAEFGQVGIRSVDVFGIESAATVADYPAIASQRPVGLTHRRRRVVAQCLPHDEPVVARWDSQAALIAQIRSRATTPMVTWPKPVPRLGSQQPGDATDANAGLSPAPLPGPACNALFGSDTSSATLLRCHATGSSGDKVGLSDGTSFPADADITPDGVLLRGLSLNQAAGSATQPAILQRTGNGEMAGRSISFWMKLPAGFSATSASILTLNRPDLARDADGAVGGDPALQNHVSLTYQTTPFPRLVLAFANDAQPLLADVNPGAAPGTPPDFASDPNTPMIDPRAGSTAAGGKALAPKRPLNRVELHYCIDLQPDRWYLVQTAIANERPGGQAIIVDGIVGREATTVGAQVEVDPARTGDHVHLPGCLVLDDATDLGNWLPTGAAVPPIDYGPSTVRSPAQAIATVRLRPLGTNVQSLLGGTGFNAVLPERGLVQIGDEYLSYEGISGAGLTNVRRGQRQNTHLGASATMARWVTMPAHRVGDRVLPGGARLVNPGGTARHPALLTGGLRSATTLGDDWAPVDRSALAQEPGNVTLEGTGGGRSVTFRKFTGSSIPVTPRNLPEHGYFSLSVIRKLDPAKPWHKDDNANGTKEANYPVGARDPMTGYCQPSPQTEVFYCEYAAGMLTVLGTRVTWGGNGNDPLQPVPMSALAAPDDMSAVGILDTDQDIYPLSLGCDADNSLIAEWGQFASDIERLVQIEDPSGPIEWLRYQRTAFPDPAVAGAGRRYFVLTDGGDCSGNRGRERTPNLKVNKFITVAPGAALLPVQSMVNPGYVLATGDAVTLASDPGGNGTRIQRVVRYRPADQFASSTDPSDVTWTMMVDVHNHYFSFTRKVTGTFTLSQSELQVWPCWNGRDLSPFGNAFGGSVVSFKTGLMPRIFRDPSAGVPLVLGPSGTGLSIDSLVAAPQTAATVDTAFASRITGFTQAGTPIAPLPTSLIADITLQADVPVFGAVAGGRACLLVGGEDMVPASTSTGGVLRGRSLFGSQAVAMPVTARHLDCYNASATAPVSVADWSEGPPVLQLPIGPIGELSWLDAKDPLDASGTTFLRGGEAVTTYGSVTNLVRSPVLMLVSPDGQHRELVGTVQPTTFSAVGATTATPAAGKFITAPWTRGLYQTQVDGGWNTPPAGAMAGLNHLVVSWWLRHPPPIPADDGLGGYLSSSEREALWNCRSFSWAGFALRRAGAVFDPTLFPGGLKPADVTGTFTAGQQRIVFSALSDGRAWSGVAQNAVGTAFNHGQFGSGIETDGAELRLVWRSTYASWCDSLEKIAALANQVPKAGGVTLRCLAPTRILAVEEAR